MRLLLVLLTASGAGLMINKIITGETGVLVCVVLMLNIGAMIYQAQNK